MDRTPQIDTMARRGARLLASFAVTAAAALSASAVIANTATASTVTATAAVASTVRSAVPATSDGRVPAGYSLRVHVPDAVGAKTVIGQLTVDRAVGAGYVTAYPCATGLPTDGAGSPTRSDLNFNGAINPVASNRLIVEADDDGDICVFTNRPAAIIVDVNAISFDTGITSFPNRRVDTRRPPTADTTPGRLPDPELAAGEPLRVRVPEAVGGHTVVGQLTVDRARGAGYVTAYPCAAGPPADGGGAVIRSDLNFNGAIDPVASNRLIIQADDDGDICFVSNRPVDLIVDVNGVADSGVTAVPTQRTDTRAASPSDAAVGTLPAPQVPAGGTVRVNVAEASGGQHTVIGQLTVDRARGAGFVTAYPCAAGLPTDGGGHPTRSDLNVNSAINPVASNRLVVEADANGDICFTTNVAADLVVDVNAVADTGIMSFPNQRTDTRSPGIVLTASAPGGGVPEWAPAAVLGPLDGVAALTGLPADPSVAARPIVAVKIDNYRLARPQWGLHRADAVIEYNVEGVTRFFAMFHSDIPDLVGPVRSARTADLDLVVGMNRPVFAFSGANDGVNAWIDSARGSDRVLPLPGVNGTCYQRTGQRRGPHNLQLQMPCALEIAAAAAPPDGSRPSGPARALWDIDGRWSAPAGTAAATSGEFSVAMDGLTSTWRWDPASGTYLRWQAGEAHLAATGDQIRAHNVVVLATEHPPSPVDARSPHPLTVGTGVGTVHRDGVAIEVMWSRASAASPLQLFSRSGGVPVPLDTGTTFIQLVRA